MNLNLEQILFCTLLSVFISFSLFIGGVEYGRHTVYADIDITNSTVSK